MTQRQRDAIVAQADLTQLAWERRLDPIRAILSAARATRPVGVGALLPCASI
jgi:hypothetical protein